MDFMNMGTHMTKSTTNTMTKTRAPTTNSEITIAPVTKKKMWIREDAGPSNLVPRSRRITEEEGEEEGGVKGPRIPLRREFVPSAYRLKEEEEEVTVKEGTPSKEFGAHPKEKGTCPNEEGAAAQMPDKTQKPLKRMLTPDYTLLDCSTEEMEDYLRSSSQYYSLLPPMRNPSLHHVRSPSPQFRKLSPWLTQSLPLPPQHRNPSPRRARSPPPLFHPRVDEPDVETMCQWIRSIAENLEDLSDVRHQPTYSRERMERDQEHYRYEDDYEDRDDRDCRDYRYRPGDNMKKWDGESTSKLEARVRELKQNEVNKKFVYVVDADFLEKQLRSPRHKKAEVHFRDKKASDGAKRKSDSECYDKDQ
ncbi:hypothetical protein BTVI_91840 [Pitangus sulphuratus]|nr:hypothetical protein BTVI_91840 [Pitangus sulphuratus]